MRDSQMDVLQLQRGVGHLRHSTLIRRVNAGDHAAAAGQLGKWTLAAGKELPGLPKRRATKARQRSSEPQETILLNDTAGGTATELISNARKHFLPSCERVVVLGDILAF